MADSDEHHWDERYAASGHPPVPAPPRHFPELAHHLPPSGTAIELACGRGEASVWLAQRGMTVKAFDISPVAVAAARHLARTGGVGDRTTFTAADLSARSPASEPADLLLCHLYLPHLSGSDLLSLVADGGIVAIATLSEVGARPGRFRTAPGKLLRLFPTLDVINHIEANGIARLLARNTRGRAPALPTRKEQL